MVYITINLDSLHCTFKLNSSGMTLAPYSVLCCLVQYVNDVAFHFTNLLLDSIVILVEHNSLSFPSHYTVY